MLSDGRVFRRVRVSDARRAMASGFGTTAVNVSTTCVDVRRRATLSGKQNVGKCEFSCPTRTSFAQGTQLSFQLTDIAFQLTT